MAKTEFTTETPSAANNKKVVPHDNDVLCGRGGSINNHVGNENYRTFVNRKKRVYLTARFKREKRLIAASIVQEVRNLDPSGRFLAKDSRTGDWYDIGDLKARDKTSQALREGAPGIRREMDDERKKKTTNGVDDGDDEEEDEIDAVEPAVGTKQAESVASQQRFPQQQQQQQQQSTQEQQQSPRKVTPEDYRGRVRFDKNTDASSPPPSSSSSYYQTTPKPRSNSGFGGWGSEGRGHPQQQQQQATPSPKTAASPYAVTSGGHLPLQQQRAQFRKELEEQRLYRDRSREFSILDATISPTVSEDGNDNNDNDQHMEESSYAEGDNDPHHSSMPPPSSNLDPGKPYRHYDEPSPRNGHRSPHHHHHPSHDWNGHATSPPSYHTPYDNGHHHRSHHHHHHQSHHHHRTNHHSPSHGGDEARHTRPPSPPEDMDTEMNGVNARRNDPRRAARVRGDAAANGYHHHHSSSSATTNHGGGGHVNGCHHDTSYRNDNRERVNVQGLHRSSRQASTSTYASHHAGSASSVASSNRGGNASAMPLSFKQKQLVETRAESEDWWCHSLIPTEWPNLFGRRGMDGFDHDSFCGMDMCSVASLGGGSLCQVFLEDDPARAANGGGGGGGGGGRRGGDEQLEIAQRNQILKEAKSWGSVQSRSSLGSGTSHHSMFSFNSADEDQSLISKGSDCKSNDMMGDPQPEDLKQFVYSWDGKIEGQVE